MMDDVPTEEAQAVEPPTLLENIAQQIDQLRRELGAVQNELYQVESQLASLDGKRESLRQQRVFLNGNLHALLTLQTQYSGERKPVPGDIEETDVDED